MASHSLPSLLFAAVGSRRRAEVVFSQAAPNSLSAQGTSSEFEVVPTEERNSPPESSSHTRSPMVSGWQVPGHVPHLLSVSVTWPWVRGTRPAHRTLGTMESLGDTWGAGAEYFSLAYANPLLVTSPTWVTQAPDHCESLGTLPDLLVSTERWAPPPVVT